MNDINGKQANLSLERPESLRRICHALSNTTRLDIMRALLQRSMNIGDLAEALNIPVSTAAVSARVLEEAGLITSELQPGARGTVKLCSRRLDLVTIDLAPAQQEDSDFLTLQIPIGGYSSAEGVRPTCGLAGETGYIGHMDVPRAFYLPERLQAQLIWMRAGYLEYRVGIPDIDDLDVEWLEVSFEACSEAPMYRDPWKSDVTLEINGCPLGIWTSPCDCGGRRGKLNPSWWPELNTQFGFLKTWRVDAAGSWLDAERTSDTTIGDLRLHEHPYLSLRLGVAENAVNPGGLNLFGEHFGDYGQGITVRAGYRFR